MSTGNDGAQQVLLNANDGAIEQSPAAQQSSEQVQQNTPASIFKLLLYRMIMFWFIASIVRNFIGNSNDNLTNVTNGSTKGATRNLYSYGENFSFYVYFSDSDDKFMAFDDPSALFWKQTDLVYGDWTSGANGDGTWSRSLTFDTPAALINNQSLFLHVFIVKDKQSPNPKDRNFFKREVIYGSKQINKYKKRYYQKTQNLLTGKTERTVEEQEKADLMNFEILNYWHPNFTIGLVYDQTSWQRGSVPSPVDEALVFDPIDDIYLPIFFFNDYWNLAEDYILLNDSVSQLNFTLTFTPLSLFKWMLYASQQMRSKWFNVLGNDLMEETDDQNSMKQALLETHPVLLGITIVVSLFHTVFDFLAFKNDIQFWRTRRSLEGLSVRSVLFNVFQSIVIFLYICDNDTSWLVKGPVGVGLLIELWKVPKCVNVNIDHNQKYFGLIPRISFSDKGSYVESDTKQYDQLAFKYLSWILFPLLGAYAIYSLTYVEQRGWYSWVLSMLYSFLLTFGFIMMTPQLFINYKLKSVAHLPWRMLTYKFINTFIDDLFAFVIRMPTMYRLGCFRDDIVFLIYIYQRWIYRVDPTRINEYGVSLDDPTGEKAFDLEQKSVEGAITEKVSLNVGDTKKDR